MDVKRHAHIYDDLLKLDIELNFQDVPQPSYIQEKIIQCNSYQLKVERFFIEVTRDLAIAERMFTTEKLNINTLRMSILTNDERIKKIPTGKEREAAADEMLEKNHRDLLRLENDVNDLKAILSAIRQKQNTLKSTNADVKSLQKLMEQQINRLNIGHPDDPDVKDLAKAFSDIDELEKEFEIDDVESSVEVPQSDDSDEGDSVEVDIEEFSEESVDSLILDESTVIGDESKPDPEISDETQGHGSQITEDVGETSMVSGTSNDESLAESIPADPQEDSQGGGDIEDELASILGDDDSGVFPASEEIIDEVEQVSEEEADVENVSVVDTTTSTDMSDIDIDDLSSDSDVESQVSEPPKVEVDLSDLGIDLDLGDTVPEPTRATPPTKKTEPTKDSGSEKSTKKEEKKSDPPVQNKTVEKKKTETKKAEVLDINLNDILDAF